VTSDEFERLEDEWARIVSERDAEAAKRFLADDFLLTSVGGVSSRMPRADWIAALPSIETDLLEAEVDESRTYGDVAVVKARLRWSATMGGRDLTGDYAVTDVFTRGSGSWTASWRISVRLPDS
jgi:ketosteroid isomerase-like protein